MLYYCKTDSEQRIISIGPEILLSEGNTSPIELSDEDFLLVCSGLGRHKLVSRDGKNHLETVPFSAQELEENAKAEQEEEKNSLRSKRNAVCFSVINRGELWYESLTEEQKTELRLWYRAWLDVTVSMQEPSMPVWLK